MSDISIKPVSAAFGHSAALKEALTDIGPISPQEFARRYEVPADRYRRTLRWNPTTARFWNVFSRDPGETLRDQICEHLEALLPAWPRIEPSISDAALNAFMPLIANWVQAQAAARHQYEKVRELNRTHHRQVDAQTDGEFQQEITRFNIEAERLAKEAHANGDQVKQFLEPYPLLALIGEWCDWNPERYMPARGKRFKSGNDLLAWLMNEGQPRLATPPPDPVHAQTHGTSAKDLHMLNRLLTGHHGLHANFRLNRAETALFRRNGFVVSQRLGAPSFGDLYYHLFNNDLPVFVTADSLLHAWHHSFDKILMEIEEHSLIVLLDEIFSAMQSCLSEAEQIYGRGLLAESVRDADYFLAVARGLLMGHQGACDLLTRNADARTSGLQEGGPSASKPPRWECPSGSLPACAGLFGQEARILTTLRACAAERLEENFPLFGNRRAIDFSQFKPRGHYEKSEQLQRYFQAMIWCGRTDMRVAGGDDPCETTQRQLGGALVLLDLLKRAGKFEAWRRFDRLMEAFVGRTDSFSFAQLDALLQRSRIASPAEITRWSDLEDLQADILASDVGYQQITSDWFDSDPFGTRRMQLPRSFTLMGQKFTPDSWALGQVVYDRVQWEKGKVWRRIPSCLDVAFTVLGNDHVVPDLVGRIQNKKGRKYRDGLPYQHHLAAVRKVVDGQEAEAWEASIYTKWLSCLRTLSDPTAGSESPATCRTRAWAMRCLNTQFASWTQLRHDTILYVKQSYTMAATLCQYPVGYVEPNVPFWQKLRKMASDAADLLAQVSFPPQPDEDTNRSTNLFEEYERGISPQALQQKQTAFLRHFAEQIGILQGIAEKQAARQKLTSDETKHLQNIVQIVDVVGSGGGRHYNGWYPGLFYAGREKCAESDRLVADVHTDVPADMPPDPGCVLHQGVGSVDLMVAAIENGEDRIVYAGPTFSHYEFEMPGTARKSDSEWQADLDAGKCPDRPEWTKCYLVPDREQPTTVKQRGLRMIPINRPDRLVFRDTE